MSTEELLNLEELKSEIPENDVPGFPKHVALCSKCGEHVVNGKEVLINDKILCKSCAGSENSIFRSMN